MAKNELFLFIYDDEVVDFNISALTDGRRESGQLTIIAGILGALSSPDPRAVQR
jgi:hypothetical protein